MKFDYRTEYNRYKRYYRDLTPLIKTPAAKAYTMFILSLLAMSVFGFFAIRPTIKTIVGLNKEIKDARATDKALQEKINQLSDAQQEYTKVQNDLPIILAALPADSGFSSLLKQIEATAKQTGASVSGIQFQDVAIYGSRAKKESTASSQISEIPFKISFTGDYKNAYQLVNSLSKIERIIGVENINISSSTAIEGGNLTVTVAAKAYVFP